MEFRISILLLLLGTALVSSHKQEGPSDESKIKPRYSGIDKYPNSYTLEPEGDEHYGHHGGKNQDEDYVNSEEIVEQAEKDEALGNENLDKNVKDTAYDDHAEKEAHQEFQAGGLSFDKHLKDHKADNKEVDNVKAHSAGEKFGGEAVKEHKVGKHKEKSKGHKLHGFKNVYHKEEYGDHKTFHDEFLDSDHQHNYDDQHEHKEMQGGKFSKGFKHEGKNKKYDKGDEKREWGKEDFDAQRNGMREKGGEFSKHRHGSKKHQGQYDANTQKNRNSFRKVKKGNPPAHAHHGPHHAEIQPYVSHYSPPHHSHHEYSPSHYQPPPMPAYHSDDGDKEYGNQYHDQDEHHSGFHDSTAGDAGYHVSSGGHHNHDDSQEYSLHDDTHDHDYEERTPKKHHRAAVKEHKEDDKTFVQKAEPVTFKQPDPVTFKQPEPVKNYGIHQYRQPFHQDHPQIKQHRVLRPFDRQHQEYRYGFPQARYPFHQSHHHREQPYQRFSHGHHGHHHHHHHGGHGHHFRHMSRNHPQAVQAQAVVHVTKPREDNQPIYSQRQLK